MPYMGFTRAYNIAYFWGKIPSNMREPSSGGIGIKLKIPKIKLINQTPFKNINTKIFSIIPIFKKQ